MGNKKPSSAHRLQRLNLSSFQLQLPLITTAAVLVTLLLIGLSGVWSYGKWITQVEQQRLQHYSQLQLEQHAANIHHYIREQQQQLNLLASRTALLSAVQSGDADMTASLIQSLRTAYPQAQSFKLFTPDRRELLNLGVTGDTPNETAPAEALTFTELDMIYRAQRGQEVEPEALRVNKLWSLHFIASVMEAGTSAPAAATDNSVDTDNPAVQGTLLVTLPAQDLFRRIASLAPELGQIQLQRANPGRPAPIYTSGQASPHPQHSAHSVTQAVSNSQWLVTFTPSEQLAAQAAESPLLLIVAHMLGGAILLALVLKITGKLDPQRRRSQQVGRASFRPVNARASAPGTSAAGSAFADEPDILDVYVAEEDQDLLGLGHDLAPETAPDPVASTTRLPLPDEIFRAYDIRGLAHTQITPALARQVGQAVASEALAAGDSSLFVARDGRSHSPELCAALIDGILSTGCHVLNLGAVPTPLMNFATFELPGSSSGVMVTASHNAAEYNGFKMVIKGRTLVEEDVQNLKQRMLDGDFFSGQGTETHHEVIPQYIDRILSDVALAGTVKLVIDAGNGITGEVAPLLFEELGCEVETLYCDIDGRFPNHDPDPTIVANLQDLIRTVQATGADLGVAFDGDGDRLVLVTPKGEIIWPDRLLMLFARDIVSRNPGADVLFDVKCTRELNSLVSSYGGRPIMWKTGHSNMKAKMQETGALVGGEMSGHIFIKDRWYGFDDGMYAAARLLEVMTLRDQDIDSLFASFPSLPSTPEIKIPVPEERKFELVGQLLKNGDFQNGKAITIDGLRVDFSKGWGLVRASNTSAALTLRFEAETEEALAQLQQLFKLELLKIDSSLEIPF